jgi:hypothetical protein
MFPSRFHETLDSFTMFRGLHLVSHAEEYDGFSDAADEALNATDTAANVIEATTEAAPKPEAVPVPDSDPHGEEVSCQVVGSVETNGPKSYDVYSSKSRNCEKLFGNVRLKEYALDNYDEYLSYKRTDKKKDFYTKILNLLLGEGAMFWKVPEEEKKKEKKDKLKVPKDPQKIRDYPWARMSDEEAYEKVELAFRNETAKRKKAKKREAPLSGTERREEGGSQKKRNSQFAKGQI